MGKGAWTLQGRAQEQHWKWLAGGLNAGVWLQTPAQAVGSLGIDLLCVFSFGRVPGDTRVT